MNNIEMQDTQSVNKGEHVFTLIFCIEIILQRALNFFSAPHLLWTTKALLTLKGYFPLRKNVFLVQKKFAGLNFLNQFLFSLFNVVFLVHVISI